jgi:hypothetical protein
MSIGWRSRMDAFRSRPPYFSCSLASFEPIQKDSGRERGQRRGNPDPDDHEPARRDRLCQAEPKSSLKAHVAPWQTDSVNYIPWSGDSTAQLHSARSGALDGGLAQCVRYCTCVRRSIVSFDTVTLPDVSRQLISLPRRSPRMQTGEAIVSPSTGLEMSQRLAWMHASTNLANSVLNAAGGSRT